MVFVVPHVTRLEFAPFDLIEIQSPDDRHDEDGEGCSRKDHEAPLGVM